MMSKTLKIYSWNVNGLRAAIRKGFLDWTAQTEASIIGLQEIRALPEQLPQAFFDPNNWWIHLSPAQRKGYSGVGLMAKAPPSVIQTELGTQCFDIEGRFQWAQFGKLWIANIYFPNGRGKGDNERVPYKLSFYQKVFDFVEPYKNKGAPILIMGDFNTAPTPIDLARPKQNEKVSGFLPEEREEIHRWIQAGWIDTFRFFHPDQKDAYTWWSHRRQSRARNVGWRIDLIMASPGLIPYLKSAWIDANVMGSDHCPIGVEVDAALWPF